MIGHAHGETKSLTYGTVLSIGLMLGLPLLIAAGLNGVVPLPGIWLPVAGIVTLVAGYHVFTQSGWTAKLIGASVAVAGLIVALGLIGVNLGTAGSLLQGSVGTGIYPYALGGATVGLVANIVGYAKTKK